MISVVFSTFQRAAYLKRSLLGYVRCVLPQAQQLQIVCVDDGSTDGTQELMTRFSDIYLPIDFKYIRVEKDPSIWRDCAATINMGLRAADGEYIIATHPEVIPGTETILQMWNNRADRVYNAAKIYYLTQGEQKALDTVPWFASNLAVRELPGFYEAGSVEVTGNPSYSHAAMDTNTSWRSWVFGGMTADTWKYMGGFLETNAWGTIDVDFSDRRLSLGIEDNTLMEPQTFCIHQNHDAPADAFHVPTPRDMDKAHANLKAYGTPEDMRLGHV